MYEMEWKDPPVAGPKDVEILTAELQANPGRWARVERDTNLVERIYPWWGGPAAEFDEYETVMVKTEDGLTSRDVYMRYKGV